MALGAATMKYINKISYYVLSFLLASSLLSTLISPTVSAQLHCDETFMSLNTKGFYNPCDTTCTPDGTSSGIVNKNTDYDGNIIFTQNQIREIERNKPFYEKAAASNGFPWQILAAIHLRETNLKRYGPDNEQGPYQISSGGYATGEYTDEQFQAATNEAAAFIKSKADDRNLQKPDNVKFVFFAYNGAAGIYKDQALALGFDEAEAEIGEGSPYVMNRYDAKRDPTKEPVKSNGTWGQIKTDGGAISYPANASHYGAFVYYSALALNADCASSGVNGDPQSILKSFNDYMAANGERMSTQGFNYQLSKNGCTTLTLWYITQHTTLKYGAGNGEGVVRGLVAANKDAKLSVSSTPVPLAIYSVAAGSTSWGASGGEYGHTGIVVSVDEAKKEATVLDTWSGMSGKSSKATIKTFKYPQNGVSFVHIGEHLK